MCLDFLLVLHGGPVLRAIEKLLVASDGPHAHDFSYAFGVISSTYRPLAQGTTWLAFKILDPSIFPTSVLRQALLQGCIYGMFVLAWWLIYSAAPLRRVFAVIAFIAGGVFFSGYVHLFHIYGIFYIPVMLTLGVSLRSVCLE